VDQRSILLRQTIADAGFLRHLKKIKARTRITFPRPNPMSRLASDSVTS
jgi:hypothetical protein